MTSAISNIQRIRKNLHSLRRSLGCPLNYISYHTFPNAEKIVEAGELMLRQIGLGFRAKFIYQTCRELMQNQIDLKSWEILSDEELKNRLCAFPGVGDKIAECVLLFGYGRLNAFPVDVWVRRALCTLWPRGAKLSPEAWSRWAKDRWGNSAGYVQQILYCTARKKIL